MTQPIRRALLSACLLTLGFSSACATVDLRPDALTERAPTSEEAQRGQALAQALAERHGGLDRWRAHRISRVDATDTYLDFGAELVLSPWDLNPQPFSLTTQVGLNTLEMTFEDEDGAAHTWGMDKGATYTVEGDKRAFAEHEDAAFWLPTLQFLFEAPFRLLEADAYAYLGEAEHGGRTYERVIVSWGTIEPQANTDQFILWIDKETGLLAFLDFTARAFARFARTTAIYEGYTEVEGITVPARITIVNDLEDRDQIHALDYTSVAFGE